MSKKHICIAACGILLLLAACGAYLALSSFTQKEARYVLIYDNDTYDSLCSRLDTVASPLRMPMFRTMAAISGFSSKRPHPGRYKVSGVSTFTLIQNLRHGLQEPLRYNVPLVWKPENLAKRLSTKFLTDSATFADAFADSMLLAEYDITPPELFCIIIPDTYEFYWTMSPKDFLQRMKSESKRFWNEERTKKAASQGLTPKEAVTLASIVEKETAQDDEKATIAGLYLNRLHKGMKLQADPTVKFAVGDFALRRILNRHLQTPSPYNTYMHEGLPPAPICLPSRTSIEAVLDAKAHNFIYMCAREDFSGHHNFAETFAEHQENARRYTRALNERGIK